MSRTALLGSVALCIGSYAYATESGQPGTEQATIEQLQRQMQELMRQLEELKQQQAAQQQRLEQQDQEIEQQKEQVASLPSTVAPANVVTGGDKPGSFKLPGTDTSVKIGGYVKGDLIYDVNNDQGDSFIFSAIPPDNDREDEREGNFRAHARQTRINIQTWTPTDFGEAHTYIEGDFFGGGGNEVLSNSTSFRIRHAYGELGPVRVGQHWSNFMFLDSYPDTIDFFGPVGIPFIRQGQLRYTYKGIDKLELAFSAENSELSGLTELGEDDDGNAVALAEVGTLGGTRRSSDDVQFGIDTLPDFTARASYRDDWGALSLSGVARLLEVDNGDGVDDEEFGGGVMGSFVFNLNQVAPLFGDDTLVGNFVWGDGIGRYIINGFNEDAILKADGSLESIETWGVSAAFTHYWTDNLRSNLVYGHYEVEDTFGPGFTESLDSAHVNLMWTPTDRVQFGLEYIFGARDFEDGSLDNEGNRVQFAGQFFF